MLCNYNNSYIPLMGICNITIINKCIKYGCSFFVELKMGQHVMCMPDGKWLKLQAKLPDNRKSTRKMTNKETSKITSKKGNLCTNKVNLESYYFFQAQIQKETALQVLKQQQKYPGN